MNRSDPHPAVLDTDLFSGWAPQVLLLVGVVGGLTLVLRRGRRWWTRTVPAAAITGVVLTAAAAVIVEKVWRPFPDSLPPRLLAASVVVTAAVVLTSARMVRRSWRSCVVIVVALGLVGLSAAQQVNAVYGQYPTVRTVFGLPPTDQIAALPPRVTAASAAPTPAPAGGAVVEVTIPGAASGFAARPGWVYLPPAYLATPRPTLPVLVLLAGQPGSPRNWLDGGMLSQRLDRFAAAHHGAAPVVVVVDHIGGPLDNPLCIDSAWGNVHTYLTRDVPSWIAAHLQVDPRPRARAIGGLSSGGTCALQTAVTAPGVYPVFVDLSGEQEPTLGGHDHTVSARFGGDEAAFRAVNPVDVLARTRLPGSAGFLAVGRDDDEYRPQAEKVAAACRAAGIDVGFALVPGGHDWDVWGSGLDASLPWLAALWGIP